MSEDLFSVLAAIGIIALVYRWFTTSPMTSSAGSNSATSLSALQRRALNVPRSQVDRLLTMFPQLTENEVRYALVVTRGGVEAVAERVLVRGGLEPPPPNFFPPSPTPPPAAQSNAPATNTPPAGQPGQTKTNHSLIAKLCLEPYKLEQDRAMKEAQSWRWEDCQADMERRQAAGASGDAAGSGLRERKAKMVLESRWRLLQKEKKGKSTALS